MGSTTSLNVWAQLPVNERAVVAEVIVRILTEEVDNKRFDKDSADPSRAPGSRLHPPIRSQATVRVGSINAHSASGCWNWAGRRTRSCSSMRIRGSRANMPLPARASKHWSL